MEQLVKNNGKYSFTTTKNFTGIGSIDQNTLRICIKFAYDMSFGRGHHRDHRTGGRNRRRQGEIFANALQGKLAEFAVYNELLKLNNNLNIDGPDTQVFGEGVWDTCDLVVEGRHLSIKSTKYYSQLLLLETNDWDENGLYMPNNDGNNRYDYFMLVRFREEVESIMKKNRVLFCDEIGNEKYDQLIRDIINANWIYDIPGFITYNEFVTEVIRNRQIIPQGALLGERTKMDAENYYVQAGDLHNLIEIIF